MTGPKATIRIARDADGVPTITAQNDEMSPSVSVSPTPRTGCSRWNCSAAMPPGGWPRSLARGAVPVDTQMRVLGLYRAAEAEIP